MRARAAAGTLVGFVAAALAFCAYVYASNQRMLLRVYPVAPVSFAAASGSEAVQRGKALADITGCTDCHGETLQGGAFGEPDWLHGHYYASNLTRMARGYSDADLDRIVRQGVRPDGRGVVAMPSFGCALPMPSWPTSSRSSARYRWAESTSLRTSSGRSISGIYGASTSSRRSRT
jgi:mono/diheme cytochrome c family protein